MKGIGPCVITEAARTEIRLEQVLDNWEEIN